VNCCRCLQKRGMMCRRAAVPPCRRAAVPPCRRAALPPCQVSCGFASTGARCGTIGQCWSTKASEDGINPIFISAVLSDAFEVQDTLAHELIHAVYNCSITSILQVETLQKWNIKLNLSKYGCQLVRYLDKSSISWCKGNRSLEVLTMPASNNYSSKIYFELYIPIQYKL